MSAIPTHVAIIPDGNRRWAKKRLLTPWKGHQAGFDQVRSLIEVCRDQGVRYFTLWGFSTENWNRSPQEIQKLMKIFITAIDQIAKEAHEHQIRFRHLGRKDRLPKELLQKMNDLEQKTAEYTQYYFQLALDYGGRDELLRAMQALVDSGTQVTAEALEQHLDTAGIPDLDFIIRTSGEQHLSGFMPWQGVYAEYYFTDLHFPDFGAEQFKQALAEFTNRKRRFGK